jgi:hypothetical protein
LGLLQNGPLSENKTGGLKGFFNKRTLEKLYKFNIENQARLVAMGNLLNGVELAE